MGSNLPPIRWRRSHWSRLLASSQHVLLPQCSFHTPSVTLSLTSLISPWRPLLLFLRPCRAFVYHGLPLLHGWCSFRSAHSTLLPSLSLLPYLLFLCLWTAEPLCTTASSPRGMRPPRVPRKPAPSGPPLLHRSPLLPSCTLLGSSYIATGQAFSEACIPEERYSAYSVGE